VADLRRAVAAERLVQTPVRPPRHADGRRTRRLHRVFRLAPLADLGHERVARDAALGRRDTVDVAHGAEQ
jgi:hypothetical protein